MVEEAVSFRWQKKSSEDPCDEKRGCGMHEASECCSTNNRDLAAWKNSQKKSCEIDPLSELVQSETFIRIEAH